ncbi:hypothetical protein A4A49_16221 [Nicotiana attenuata]|uniref:Uncharacterized protein n=1 Tax=Nicotiana attenuata TaxID=49451 RepID=A0A314KMC8_NICAT|nr:hypothetical protein A4A49_16221 [Nicotiana attenuata]
MQINNAICKEPYHHCLKMFAFTFIFSTILIVWVLMQPHSSENKRTVTATTTADQQHASLEARFTERTKHC